MKVFDASMIETPESKALADVITDLVTAEQASLLQAWEGQMPTGMVPPERMKVLLLGCAGHAITVSNFKKFIPDGGKEQYAELVPILRQIADVMEQALATKN